MSQAYIFHGDSQRRTNTAHKDAPKHPEPYITSPQLVDAVNLAILLRRPLLIEGEAGCGKTRLAHAVAYELGLPLYTWPVRSTSKAQDGLYTYDALARLHDVHIRQMERQSNGEPLSSSMQSDPSKPENYLRAGPLGQAFGLEEHPAVVLIDEIDKADIDFPNDLLTVLDEPWSFTVSEVNKRVTAKHPPIVIITSNKEKGNLPAPFLRRCIYFFIDFPHDKEHLKAIIDAHMQARNNSLPAIAEPAIRRFLDLRSGELYKKPGTSELLDWVEALSRRPPPNLDLEKKALPYPELLIKRREDWQRVVKGQ
jgi:MoxR-like ATPase